MNIESDTSYEEYAIESVKSTDSEYRLTLHDGWSIIVNKPSPIVPSIGMKVKLYGKGLGYPIRGIKINDVVIFYRTEEEDKKHKQEQIYGKNIKDWLKRWDAGDSVWSIEMGGLGPRYEQAIQVTAAEIVRYIIEKDPSPEIWYDEKLWKGFASTLEKELLNNSIINKLELSGAQWGAAFNLATNLYKLGPIGVMNNKAVKDRHIQVSKYFPGV